MPRGEDFNKKVSEQDKRSNQPRLLPLYGDMNGMIKWEPISLEGSRIILPKEWWFGFLNIVPLF